MRRKGIKGLLILKILFVNTTYAPNLLGGAERSVQSLAEGMARAGHQTVVVSAAPEKGVRIEWLNGVKAYYVGIKNLYWPFRSKDNPITLKPVWHAIDSYNHWMAREIEHALVVERPDLVHTNNLVGFSALIWRPIKQRNLPLVHTLRDYYLLCPRSSMFRNGENCGRVCTRCRLYTLPRRHLSGCVDTVVGVSRFVLERHLEFGCFAATPKRVIYNTYRVEPVAPLSERRPLPIRFGYLGRLLADKGLEELLKAVARLPEGTWSLDVAGRGTDRYERYLRTRYAASAVRFLGHVEPEEFFPEIDVLVVPSVWNDPSPRVFSEAYAHGVPVIGSNRGGNPELVEEGHTGFLFDPGRTEELTAKMRGYVDKPSMIAGMRPACLRKADSARPEDTARQYLEVYADALGVV